MTTIVTRASKGSALTYAEMDANFNNLNTDKLEAGTSATNIANTPAGNIVATNVQSAINELDTEKLSANATSLNGTTIPANETLVVTTDISSTIMPWVAPSTTGNVLTSNGTIWTSSPNTSRQIQSISAVVSANALTISAAPLSLEFRSTTLGSGATTIVSGTPSNLVISSGSTLGTINAVASRIIVLAINNAGTIELAAVNISGDNNLTETGLISTTAEGGAGTADSASTIYSTTARSNVAYRVLGYIESTQATAGTWATGPTLVQGAGGEATKNLAIGFNSLLSANGYQKLPSGLIIQWGKFNPVALAANSAATTSVTFNIAFPNEALVAASTKLSTGPSNLGVVAADVRLSTLTTTGMAVDRNNKDTTNSVTFGFTWLAIGY